MSLDAVEIARTDCLTLIFVEVVVVVELVVVVVVVLDEVTVA